MYHPIQEKQWPGLILNGKNLYILPLSRIQSSQANGNELMCLIEIALYRAVGENVLSWLLQKPDKYYCFYSNHSSQVEIAEIHIIRKKREILKRDNTRTEAIKANTYSSGFVLLQLKSKVHVFGKINRHNVTKQRYQVSMFVSEHYSPIKLAKGLTAS